MLQEKEKYAGINKKLVLLGMMSYVPGLLKLLRKGKGALGTGGTNNSKYCYTVWLRHLSNLYNCGMHIHPEKVVEIGPGDSLGVGLCALLTGAKKFYAFDIIAHSNYKKNLAVFDNLVELVKKQAPIPDQAEFPAVSPVLDNYSFPGFLKNLVISDEKINNIRKAITDGVSGDIEIKYVLPGKDSYDLFLDSIDLVYSQAVFEHIEDLESIYRNTYGSLKRGGYSSHSIDFSAHNVHKVWNGHWYISEKMWNIIMHGASYSINRKPFSYHLDLIKKNNFTLLQTNSRKQEGFVSRDDLNPSVKSVIKPDVDFEVTDTFMVLKK
jgi:hypothetical protein